MNDREYLQAMGEHPHDVPRVLARLSQADPALSDELPGEGLGMAVSQEGDGS